MAVANYAPRPTCPPGSYPFDANGSWLCKEILRPDGGGLAGWGRSIAPVQTTAPPTIGSGPQIHPSRGDNVPRFGVGSIGGTVLRAPWASGLTNGSAPPTFGLPSGGLPAWQPLIPSSPFSPAGLGPVATAGCDLLPQSLRAACKAAAGLIPGSTPQVPGGSQSPVPGTVDPTPGYTTPGEASTGVGGLMAPMLVQRNRFECPKTPGRPSGIVHYSPMTGAYVCLPRGVSGAAFGLVRKNPRRAKAYVTAAEIKTLKTADRTRKKAKKFAKLAGQTCTKRGR